MAFIMVLGSSIRTPENQTLIGIITLSIFVNVIVLLVAFGTGIGIDLIKRFSNKLKYKSGNFVNTVLIMKSGIAREFFKKKDNETNHFKINDTKYITNPRLLFVYRGIPTYFHREGNPDPLNIWQDGLAGELSNAEMDNVMNSKGMFDLKEWLDKNKTFMLMALIGMVAAAGIAAFFGYMSYEMLRDGSFKMGQVVCSNIPKAPVITGQVL